MNCSAESHRRHKFMWISDRFTSSKRILLLRSLRFARLWRPIRESIVPEWLLLALRCDWQSRQSRAGVTSGDPG